MCHRAEPIDTYSNGVCHVNAVAIARLQSRAGHRAGRNLESVEKVLSGGNTHEEVVRVDDTVRRPTGPWTPGVHALLVHLQKRGFEGAPRVHGIDEQGREVLDYIEVR